jgi:hypothetical protein
MMEVSVATYATSLVCAVGVGILVGVVFACWFLTRYPNV